MAPKKISYTPVQDAAVVLPQEQKPPEVIPSEPAKPTYDDQWFDDPIEGEEAIRMEQQLRQKIEEKAEPVRTWLEKNIVPILLQALEAVCAHRRNQKSKSRSSEPQLRVSDWVVQAQQPS
ncbi:uncharacterized protein [Physcomitrium patens]|uniref:uncharacterized protein isoform X3 n=1 Tax=Physcomitrium patens TaxID=3218 RepID=UPI000D16486E|nr:uncharacterized protein LOC112275996 isoform X3 [Physcomitrium patens]|eukprot:XP_024362667.1 uncharacterized protein LOC112275996 isoform X3 [Physcomitrella patens]